MDNFPRDPRLNDGGADDGMVWAVLGVGGCGLKGWRKKDPRCLEWSKPHQTDCSSKQACCWVQGVDAEAPSSPIWAAQHSSRL